MTEQKLTSLTEILERVSRIRAEKASTVTTQKTEVDPELVQEIEKMRSEFERDGIEYTEPASRQKITQSPETKQTLLLKALFNRGFFLAS